MMFIAKSPSAARPSRQGAGCASVRLSCSAHSAKVDTGFAEYAPFKRFEHFLAANRNATLPENARVRGFGARIRQRQAVVTRPSGFLGVFGPWFWPPRDRAGALWSGPRPRPGARPRPGRDPRTTGFPGSAGPRTL